MAAFSVLLLILFAVQNTSAICGHYFGKPLDLCVDSVSFEYWGDEQQTSQMYLCDSDTGQYYKYYFNNNTDCLGEYESIENVTQNCINGNKYGNACKCGDGDDCDNVITQIIDENCGEFAGYYSEESMVLKQTCIVNEGTYCMYTLYTISIYIQKTQKNTKSNYNAKKKK